MMLHMCVRVCVLKFSVYWITNPEEASSWLRKQTISLDAAVIRGAGSVDKWIKIYQNNCNPPTRGHHIPFPGVVSWSEYIGAIHESWLLVARECAAEIWCCPFRSPRIWRLEGRRQNRLPVAAVLSPCFTHFYAINIFFCFALLAARGCRWNQELVSGVLIGVTGTIGPIQPEGSLSTPERWTRFRCHRWLIDF